MNKWSIYLKIFSLKMIISIKGSNLVNESKPGSSSLKFCPIDEDSEDSHIKELNIVQSPSKIDENMNLVFRNNGYLFYLHLNPLWCS